MPAPRTPENWLAVFDGKNDAEIAGFLLDDLVGYRDSCSARDDDVQHVLAFITALRLQQLASAA